MISLINIRLILRFWIYIAAITPLYLTVVDRSSTRPPKKNLGEAYRDTSETRYVWAQIARTYLVSGIIPLSRRERGQG